MPYRKSQVHFDLLKSYDVIQWEIDGLDWEMSRLRRFPPFFFDSSDRTGAAPQRLRVRPPR